MDKNSLFNISYTILNHRLQAQFENDLVQRIAQKYSLQKINEYSHTYEFTISNLLYLSFAIELNIYRKLDSHIFRFSVQYRNLVFVLIGFIVASALFSRYSVHSFLWFSGISISIVWIVFYLLLRKHLVNLVAQCKQDESLVENLSKEQEQWILDTKKCPACGADLTQYSSHCAECGLYIQHIPPFSRFTLSENLDPYTLTYTITHEKD